MFLLLWKRWKFSLKKWWAKVRLKECIKSEQSHYQKDLENLILEKPRLLDMEKSVDTLMFYGQDQLENSLLVQISRRRRRESEVWLILRLKDGRTFTLPDHPATQIFNVRADAFHAAGLSMTALVTLKTSRIKFNGLLRPDIRREESSSFNEEDLLPVRFNFIFSAKSKPLYWPYDWNLDLMATALAAEKWEGLSFLGMLTEPDSRGYDQYGAMKGEVFIGKKKDSAPERIELNLPGIKVRRWGPLPASHMNEMALIVGVCGDGMVFNVGVLASQEGLKHAQFGSIIHPNGLWDSINWTDLRLEECNKENALANSCIIEFRVQRKMYKVELRTQRRSRVRLFRGRPIDWVTDCHSVSLVVNGEIGYGIRIASRLDTLSNVGQPALTPIYKTLTYYSIPPEPDKFIYLFFEDAAKSIPISGLKGASLAMLSVLALSSTIAEHLDPTEGPAQRAVAPPEFTVPEGFIISSMALQKIIRTNVTIEKGIERLMVLAGEQMDFQYQCAEVANMIRYVDMDTEISNAINIAYKSLRENVTGKRKDFVLAVRSSITVEDSREVTASGLYENVLGVSNGGELLAAIKSCWASLYSCKNVQHRRDTIQPINLDMAVVIQMMVNADSGGLLMTQNPTSLDPYQSLISSNFGLGGSISAGEGQPDTFLVKRSYDFRLLTVEGKTVGTKKIVVQVNKKGVVQKKTSLLKVASLTNEIAVRLTRLGIELERLYGHVMNIEWALVGTEIFLLQCRRIFTGIELTDWELKHEFDSPVMSSEDLYTTANIGEILTKAVTLPTMFFISLLDKALKKHVDENKHADANINRFVPCFNYHMFLDVFNFNLTNNKQEMTVTDIVTGYTIMGKEYMTQDIHRIALKRYPVNSRRGFRHILQMLTARDYAGVSNIISDAFKNYYSKSNLMDFESALDLLDDIEGNFWRLYDCSRCHYNASFLSTFYVAVAVILISDHHPVMAPEVQEDIRIILSGVNGSVSGEIPKKVEELMRLILMSGKKAEFCQLYRPVAEEWLQMNIPEAAKAFEVFIQKNRHRGMEEMEVFSISWGEDPKLVIEMLQKGLWNVKTEEDLNDHKLVVHHPPGQLVRQLRAAKGWIRRRVLRTVIGRVQKAALAREVSKNSLVSCLYEFRVAFRYLGGLMVREGLLSSPDLLFFMTPTEWRTLIKERSFTLVRRAQQRKRVFLELREEDFLEFNSGVPVPMKRNLKSDALVKNAVKGTPICGGVVKGPAAVLTGSKEMWNIQAGDIVITQVLDIGWSPYFPVIKGIVTELGGLLSHGTAVAKDYGLPCIVGATDATVFFEHGEMVTLDADNGVLFRELK